MNATRRVKRPPRRFAISRAWTKSAYRRTAAKPADPGLYLRSLTLLRGDHQPRIGLARENRPVAGAYRIDPALAFGETTPGFFHGQKDIALARRFSLGGLLRVVVGLNRIPRTIHD